MRSDRNFIVIRSIMLAITAAIAAYLLLSGHLILGLLFAALTVTRVAMFFSMRKRRSELRERFQARAAAGGRRGPWGQGPGATP